MAGRDHFSPDYLESRRRFRERAEGRGAAMETLTLRTDGPDAEPLTIDVAWFGPKDAKHIVAVSSATHGVEGFMGAAVQNQLLSDLPALPGALDLRPDQVAAIDRLLAEETADLRELVARHREAMREPVAARRQRTEDEILTLLDPDQRVTYEQRAAH